MRYAGRVLAVIDDSAATALKDGPETFYSPVWILCIGSCVKSARGDHLWSNGHERRLLRVPVGAEHLRHLHVRECLYKLQGGL